LCSKNTGARTHPINMESPDIQWDPRSAHAHAGTQDAKKVATSPKALAAGAPKNAEPAAPPPKRIVAPKINETGPKSSAAGVAKTEKAAGDTAKDAKGAKRPRAPSAYSLFADQMRSSLKGVIFLHSTPVSGKVVIGCFMVALASVVPCIALLADIGV